jgi:hypothetical protein
VVVVRDRDVVGVDVNVGGGADGVVSTDSWHAGRFKG